MSHDRKKVVPCFLVNELRKVKINRIRNLIIESNLRVMWIEFAEPIFIYS